MLVYVLADSPITTRSLRVPNHSQTTRTCDALSDRSFPVGCSDLSRGQKFVELTGKGAGSVTEPSDVRALEE